SAKPQGARKLQQDLLLFRFKLHRCRLLIKVFIFNIQYSVWSTPSPRHQACASGNSRNCSPRNWTYSGCAEMVQGSVRKEIISHSTLAPAATTSEACCVHGNSLAQWAVSITAGPPARRCSSTGWWRRSEVTYTSTPSARAWSRKLSPAPEDTATRLTFCSGSPAARTPHAVSGRALATC